MLDAETSFCVVILSEGIGKLLQVVKFDRTAKVMEVFSGQSKHGPPPPGVNPTDVFKELKKKADHEK